MFNYITYHAGRRRRKLLARVHEINSDNEIIRTYVAKEDIEALIMKCNKYHFAKAHQTNVFNDETCYQSQQDKVRDQIPSRKVQQGDCDNEEACEFLKLVANLRKKNTRGLRLILEEY